MIQKYFSTSRPILPTINNLGTQLRSCWLNFGPQHPAAHGIVRLNMQIHGELLCRVDPQFGLLHRGTEKLIETRTTVQALPYFDRFDYVANLFQEHVYCLSIESLLNSSSSSLTRISTIRLFFDELSRVLNHLLTLSATSLDLSAMGPIFWAFEEREKIMELFERVSGARMHTALYHPNYFDFSVLSNRFWLDCISFLNRTSRALAGAFLGLLHNRSLKTRLGGIGQLSSLKLKNYGITGVIARSSGLLSDLRLHNTRSYSSYRAFSFRTFIGRRGDNLDRFLIRIKEVIESFRIIAQAIQILKPFSKIYKNNFYLNSFFLKTANKFKKIKVLSRLQYIYNYKSIFFFIKIVDLNFFLKTQNNLNSFFIDWGVTNNYASTRLKGTFTGMEELISHFKWASEGFLLSPGFSYRSVEAPKGELGVTLFSDGSPRPYRLKVRTPVAHNLHLIPSLGSGVFFADFVASFCSLDVVFGEIDR